MDLADVIPGLPVVRYPSVPSHRPGTGVVCRKRQGQIPAELIDEVAGGTLTAGPDRLEAESALGLPQVVSIGATDQIAFTPPQAVPADYRERNC